MWQTQIVPRLRTVFWEVDPVSALLKNEACGLQDEVVTGEKRECRCSTLQTDLKFSNYLPSLASCAGIAFKFEGESCRGSCQNRKTLDQLCNLCGPTMLPPPPQYSIVTENMRCENLQQSDICMANTIRKNIAPKYHYRDTLGQFKQGILKSFE